MVAVTGNRKLALGLMGVLLLIGCSEIDNQVITGLTMGTSYRILMDCEVTPQGDDIAALLDQLNATFSTYLQSSEINQVNDAPVGNWIAVDPWFVDVTQLASDVYRASEGAFDPTVAPLVDALGFGPSSDSNASKDRDEKSWIAEFDRLDYRISPPGVRKLSAIRLDFSGIAKGFAVDVLAKSVETSGCLDYLVEIGGEVRVNGQASGERPWRIAIENPAAPGVSLGYLKLNDGAIATSGTYLNKQIQDGVHVSHIVDPDTRDAIAKRAFSASVYAGTAAEADAWATALVASKHPIRLVKQQNLEALIINGEVTDDPVVVQTGVFATDFVSM